MPVHRRLCTGTSLHSVGSDAPREHGLTQHSTWNRARPDGDWPAGFTGDDLALLAQLTRGNEWLRAVLCTLARRGTALWQSVAVRAQAWIDALAVYPWFKGGQLLFD